VQRVDDARELIAVGYVRHFDVRERGQRGHVTEFIYFRHAQLWVVMERNRAVQYLDWAGLILLGRPQLLQILVAAYHQGHFIDGVLAAYFVQAAQKVQTGQRIRPYDLQLIQNDFHFADVLLQPAFHVLAGAVLDLDLQRLDGRTVGVQSVLVAVLVQHFVGDFETVTVPLAVSVSRFPAQLTVLLVRRHFEPIRTFLAADVFERDEMRVQIVLGRFFPVHRQTATLLFGHARPDVTVPGEDKRMSTYTHTHTRAHTRHKRTVIIGTRDKTRRPAETTDVPALLTGRRDIPECIRRCA